MASTPGSGNPGQNQPLKATPTTTRQPTVVTKNEILAKLTDDEARAAENCLKRSGKITITFGEIEVTQLPAVLDNGRLID